MKSIRAAYRMLRAGLKRIYFFYSYCITVLKFWLNGVEFDSSVRAYGIPRVNIGPNAKCKIGEDFAFKSGKTFNQIGRPQPTYFTVRYNGELIIGNNVAISNTAIVCEKRITIGNNVRIGANVVIYDSDFHSLDIIKRTSTHEDRSDIIRKPVVIEDGVFIGAHAIILKGVTIGKNSIVGAASVVTRNIPPNEIWAGNPAVFVKSLPYKQEVQFEILHD